MRLNKPQIKQLFQQEFGAHVIKVQTHIGAKRRPGYLANYKRAIIRIQTPTARDEKEQKERPTNFLTQIKNLFTRGQSAV